MLRLLDEKAILKVYDVFKQGGESLTYYSMEVLWKEKRKQEKPLGVLQKLLYPLNTKVNAIYSMCLHPLKEEKEDRMDLHAYKYDVYINLFGFDDDNILKGSLSHKC